jgi:hypothetical protein
MAQLDTAAAKEVIVLIHGIRTQAAWVEMVAGVLERELSVEVQPIRYGFFDTLRFLSPWFTRQAPIERVIRELRDIRSDYPNANISAICHSFGTYALVEALKQPDIKLSRLILCGCIVTDQFRRAGHKAQLGPDLILNDCGTHDIWPILAKSATWGYGATGTFGFGTRGIRDRFNKFGHGDYFTEEFVRDYWVPFLRSGEIRETAWERNRTPSPYWYSLLQWLPLRWVFATVLAVGIFSGLSLAMQHYLNLDIDLYSQKTLKYYSSYVTLAGTSEECRRAKCRITYHDSAFLVGPRGAELSYEGRAMTSGRILSMRTSPPYEVMNPNQWPDNPTVLMFKISPASRKDRILQATGELLAEATFSSESGKVGPHLPYDARYVVFVLDLRGLGFELRNLEPQIETRRYDGKLLAGYASPRMTLLENGKIVVVTASNLPAGSSVYVKWGQTASIAEDQR